MNLTVNLPTLGLAGLALLSAITLVKAIRDVVVAALQARAAIRTAEIGKGLIRDVNGHALLLPPDGSPPKVPPSGET